MKGEKIMGKNKRYTLSLLVEDRKITGRLYEQMGYQYKNRWSFDSTGGEDVSDLVKWVNNIKAHQLGEISIISNTRIPGIRGVMIVENPPMTQVVTRI